MVAVEARLHVSGPRGPAPRIGAHIPEQNASWWLEKRTGSEDRDNFLQDSLEDFWYVDDGDILCHPALVIPYLAAFDAANALVGAEMNRQTKS